MRALFSKTVLGDLPDFQADPLAFVERHLIAADKPVPVRFGPRRFVLAARPSAVRHVLVDNREVYDKGPEIAKLLPVFGESVVTSLSSSERWRDTRKTLAPTFGPKSLDHGLELALGVLGGEIAKMAALRLRPINLHDTMGRISMRMAAAALFHCAITDEQADTIQRSCAVAHERISESAWRPIDIDTLLPTPKRARFRDAIAGIHRVAEEVVASGGGILAGMRQLADKYGPDCLRNEAVTMLVAGFETTASTAGWLLYALACRPDLVDWLREEADGAVAAGGDIPASKLRELPRAKAIVQEVMRLYPSTWWYARTAQADDVLDGVPVTKGTSVLLVPWVLHRQPDIWGANAAEFDPTRFLGRPDHDRHAFVPFGAGPRVCLGQHLATYNLMAMAVAAVSAFDLIPLGAPLEERRPFAGVTLGHPREGLTIAINIRPRQRLAA